MDSVAFNHLVDDVQILPGINELVNVLYNDHINEFLDKKSESFDDKRVLLMFLIMYFYSFLSIPKELKFNNDMKHSLKAFLSDIIINQDKRKKCLEMYKSFENTVQLLMFSDSTALKTRN